MYAQGTAATNGHLYAVFDLNSVDVVNTAAIYDFTVKATGYTYNGLMLCGGLAAQTEDDGMTWYNGSLVFGTLHTSGTGTIYQTQWPTFLHHGFTVSAWATKEVNLANNVLLSKFYGATGDRSWALENMVGLEGFYLRGTNEQYIFQGVNGGTNFPFYIWHNFTVTFDGLNLVGYTDGRVAISNPTMAGASTAIALPSPTDVLIGALSGGSQFWQGFMRDVRMWNRPLSATEVQRLYLEGP
jgi:hypothetical protein